MNALKKILTSLIFNFKLFIFSILKSEKPFIAVIWDYVIMAMILFFVYSIINSLANKEKVKFLFDTLNIFILLI